jgi:gliding motility-associated-like protein
MTEKDHIKELFAKGLQEHQVSVDPALWSSISSSIGASSAKAGLSILTKALIGIAASSVIGVAVYFSVQANSKAETTQTKELQKETKKNTPTQEATNNNSNQTISFEETPVVLKQNNTVNIPVEDTVLNIQVLQTNPAPIQNQSIVVPSALIPHSIPVNIPNNAVRITTTPSIAPQPNSSSQVQAQVLPKQYSISLPNIFTPNGDGQNETLQIEWKQQLIEDFSIVVLNQSNNVLFSSSLPEFSWDGTDPSGEKIARGTYIYFVTGMLNGQKWQQSSSLQIQY